MSGYEPSKHLDTFSIAGFQHWDGATVISELKVGQKLELEPQRDNPYDANAIAIRFNGSRRHPSQGVCTFLQADDLNVVNDFDQERIAPHTMPVRVDADGVLRMELPANFFGVFELH